MMMLNRRGLTLVETAIALVITGFIVAAVWVVMAKVNFNNNLARTERGLIQTITNIRNFYKDRPTVSGLNNNIAIDFDLFAPELLIGGTPVHHLGANGTDNITLGVDTALCTASTTAYFINLEATSREGCNRITAHLAGSPANVRDYNILSVRVNGNHVLNATNNLNVATALAQCGNSNTVVICLDTRGRLN